MHTYHNIFIFNVSSNNIMIGMHIDSSYDNLIDSVNDAYNNGSNIVQLFVGTDDKLKKYVYNDFKKFLIKHDMTCVVHISYTINCAREWNENSIWIIQFINEIRMAHYIGAKSCIIHVGKQMGESFENAMNAMYTSLLYVHSETQNLDIDILIETSSGQGTEMAYKIKDLGYLFRKFSQNNNEQISKRFGICVDTCHVFTAGHDITNTDMREIFLDKFNEYIGLKYIKLIHLNDSKTKCGSRIDRHENIGNGFIGKVPLIHFAKLFHEINVSIILETPLDKILNDLEMLKNI